MKTDGRGKTPGQRICQTCGKSRPINEMRQTTSATWLCHTHPEKEKKNKSRDGASDPHYDPNWGPMPL